MHTNTNIQEKISQVCYYSDSCHTVQKKRKYMELVNTFSNCVTLCQDINNKLNLIMIYSKASYRDAVDEHKWCMHKYSLVRSIKLLTFFVTMVTLNNKLDRYL